MSNQARERNSKVDNLTAVRTPKRIGKKLIATLLTVAMLIGVNTGVFATGSQGTTSSPYIYRSLEGLENYKTHAEKVALFQIDETSLANMSTSELVDAVLEYPYIIDIYAFNDYATGYQSVKSSFNGLQELERRSDASTVLMEKYRSAPVNLDFLIFPNIEIIASQQIFTEQLSEEQNSELVAIADIKYQQRCSMSANNLSSAKAFYETMSTYATVKTPRNSAVQVEIRGEELEQFQKEKLNEDYRLLYPNARLLSNPTTNYNCHSYAWYWQSTSNTYWMEDPSSYMSDGSYSLRYGGSVSTGDRIYYGNGVHTAIANFSSNLNGNNLRVTSKWGKSGLYDHYFLDSPYSDAYYSLKAYY